MARVMDQGIIFTDIGTPVPMTAKFVVLKQTHGLRLHSKFRLDQFILSASGGEKPKSFYHFIDFGILWCRQLAAISES